MDAVVWLVLSQAWLSFLLPVPQGVLVLLNPQGGWVGLALRVDDEGCEDGEYGVRRVCPRSVR